MNNSTSFSYVQCLILYPYVSLHWTVVSICQFSNGLKLQKLIFWAIAYFNWTVSCRSKNVVAWYIPANCVFTIWCHQLYREDEEIGFLSKYDVTYDCLSDLEQIMCSLWITTIFYIVGYCLVVWRHFMP